MTIWTVLCPVVVVLRYNPDDMNSDSPHPANRCHFCAATSYHHLIARDQIVVQDFLNLFQLL